jgi:hypothetical protein
MTLTRLPDSDLSEIARRLNTPLNDDGYRVWYRHDVTDLLQEVMSLRRERAQAMAILGANPPLEGLEQTTPLSDVATRLAELWKEHQQGVWQRAEVKRIREELATTKLDLAAGRQDREEKTERIAELAEQVAQLEAKLVDTVADGQLALRLSQEARAETNRQGRLLLGRIADLLAE